MGCAYVGVDRGLDQVDEMDGVDALTAEMARSRSRRVSLRPSMPARR